MTSSTSSCTSRPVTPGRNALIPASCARFTTSYIFAISGGGAPFETVRVISAKYRVSLCCGDCDGREPARREEPLDDRGCREQRLHAAGDELARSELVDVVDLRRAGLLLRAALLERVGEHHDLAPVVEDDLRIGREEPDRVIHVREPIRVAVEEERSAVLHGRTLHESATHLGR